MRGLAGSIDRSLAPLVALSPLSTGDHVFPPSVDRYTPRSGVPFQRSPCAATYTRSGFCGCTRTAAICLVVSRPARVQVLPASVLLYTPSPYDDDWPRMACSPVPT